MGFGLFPLLYNWSFFTIGTNNNLIITHSDHLCGVLRHKGTAALPGEKKKSFEIYEALYKHQVQYKSVRLPQEVFAERLCVKHGLEIKVPSAKLTPSHPLGCSQCKGPEITCWIHRPTIHLRYTVQWLFFFFLYIHSVRTWIDIGIFMEKTWNDAQKLIRWSNIIKTFFP